MKTMTSFLNTTLSFRRAVNLSLLSLVCVLSQVHGDVATVGIYDENLTDEDTVAAGVQNNVVDVSATSDTGNQVSLATFTSAVQTAFTNDLGGVINFDTGTITSGFGTSSMTATFGTAQSKSITITSAATTNWGTNSSGNRTAISHPIDGTKGNQLFLTGGAPGSSDSEDFVFIFQPADKVVMVGGTILSRTGAANVTFNVTATFSDLSTPANTTTSTVSFGSSGGSNGGNDTFAGFKAPNGYFITRVRFDNTDLAGSFRSLDDLGFITSPLSPIESWRQTNFGSPANTGNGADDFDADFDGFANLVEYAFDLNPNQPSVSPVVIVPPSGYLKIQFPRFADRTDIIYNVRASENLSTWTTIASSTGGAAISASGAHSASETGAGDQKTVTVEDSALINSTPKRFLKIEIVR